ncbi:MAG: polyketide synthase, partial [Pseudomonadota bacterium]
MAARYAEDLPGKHGPTGPPPPDRRAAAAWGITAQPLDLAVTGIACRLPGATDPAAFWALLSEGRRAITAIPEDRWATTKFDRPRPGAHKGGAEEDAEASSARAAPGMAYSRAAGVLEDLWGFDAGFFGISAREAAQMDPQQRLVLELAWEAVEDACFAGGGFRRDPADPSGPGRTGVYVGAAAMDHALRFAADTGAIDSPFMTGNTLSIIANRVSHFFDFRGPSMVIDTACASSLTALHVAAGALARGEIDTAVVAGVNVLLQPHNFVGFCAAEMLSPSGRCRPFAEGADGYVRGEGAVVLVLRRRADTLSAGQPVQAVLCASGIGTDGHKAGLTRPATAAQAALIEAVHTAAGLEHGQLAFAEAHGTGTPTGDPVEAEALARALGAVRWAAGLGPLPIGSVKGNIGHLEPAAGLAGVLKAILALGEGTLPASLGAETVSPKIAALESLCVARAALPLALQEAAEREPPAACVSSFGFGGANAHLVLRAASAAER